MKVIQSKYKNYVIERLPKVHNTGIAVLLNYSTKHLNGTEHDDRHSNGYVSLFDRATVRYPTKREK